MADSPTVKRFTVARVEGGTTTTVTASELAHRLAEQARKAKALDEARARGRR